MTDKKEPPVPRSRIADVKAEGATTETQVSATDRFTSQAERISATAGERVFQERPAQQSGSAGKVGTTFESRVSGSPMQDSGATNPSGWTDSTSGSDQWAPDNWMDMPGVGAGSSETPGRDVAEGYLVGSGRYTNDDVSNMSDAEVRDALDDEAVRATIGYDGPVSGETALGWALAEHEAETREMAREYLISQGWSAEVVEGWDDKMLAAALDGEALAELHGAGGIGSGQEGSGSTSLNLGDMGHGPAPSGGSSGEGEGGDEASDSSSSGTSSGDDDEDDEDRDSQAELVEAAVGEEEDEDQQSGSGAAPEESTPTPDHFDANPQARAAFLASEMGAGQRALDEAAIGQARSGGLIVGDGDNPGARKAWMQSDMAAGERSLAAESVGMATGGGVTDPADGEPVVADSSEVDLMRLPGAGLVNPVDDTGGSGGLSPLGGIGGLGPLSGMVDQAGVDSSLADDLAGRVEDLDLDF